MTLPSLVRELRRSPRLVLAAALVAALLAGVLALRAGDEAVGVAQVAAIIDTERSQAVDARAGGGGITPLEDRAKLLADLMTRAPLRDEIADAAGVPRTELIAERPMNGLEQRLTVPEVRRLSVTVDDPRASILRAAVTDLAEGESPIIAVDVRAPDAERARRLADGAIAALSAYVDGAAPAGSPGADKRLVVRQLEPAIAATAEPGSGLVPALLAGIAVFLLGCALIIAVGRLRAAARPAPAA